MSVKPWQILLGGGIGSLIFGFGLSPVLAGTLILDGQLQSIPDGVDACSYVYQLGYNQCFYNNNASRPHQGYHVINTRPQPSQPVYPQNTGTGGSTVVIDGREYHNVQVDACAFMYRQGYNHCHYDHENSRGNRHVLSSTPLSHRGRRRVRIELILPF